MSRERPILFSAPMVRAILEGRKTQTRRIVKDSAWCNFGDCDFDGKMVDSWNIDRSLCPYGQAGDRLWVRETTRADIVAPHTWRHTYVADGAGVDLSPSFDPGNGYKPLRATKSRPVTPSIHMPRWASRIDLEVTGVRVERLQDISEADALAEGIWKTISGHYSFGDEYNPNYLTARDAFRALWESINGADSWTANPWVWVVEFRQLKAGG